MHALRVMLTLLALHLQQYKACFNQVCITVVLLQYGEGELLLLLDNKILIL